jgi:hypothetical protein
LPEGFLFFGRERTQLLQQRSQLPGFAEELRFGVLKGRRIAGGGELRDCATNYFF